MPLKTTGVVPARAPLNLEHLISTGSRHELLDFFADRLKVALREKRRASMI